MRERVGGWLSDRLGLRDILHVIARHPVPPGTTSRWKGWMYVFGTATLVAFILQVVTGIALATKYVPVPAHAYESLRHITEDVSFGRLLRGMHFFGASAMVILVGVHALRTFLTGSYKFPRELNWITGVGLLALTIAMAFTGQLLRWDADGVWGVFVASHYAGRVPLVGETLKQLVLGGDTVGGATLTRFYALHVVLMPLLIFAIIGLHLYLVLHHGVSEPPKPGRPVDPVSYRSWYRQEVDARGRPYFPEVVWREAVFGAVVVTAVIVLAVTLGPKGPGEPANPTLIPSEPKPDWFLLWYYGLISVKPPQIETFVMVYLPLLVFGGLILLPLLFGRGERAPLRRPWAILGVGVMISALGVLTYHGAQAPWVMDFETEPLDAREIAGASPAVAEGARLFHERGCQYCHAVNGRGGDYGPSLAGIMDRLPPGVVTARIVEGFGDMPAYRGMLTRDELHSILLFIRALEAP